jgi:hypothetical protein
MAALERFPGLRLVLAHGGGALMAVRGRLRHAHTFQPQARARLRGSPDESLARLCYDTVTHDTELLRSLIMYAGSDQDRTIRSRRSALTCRTSARPCPGQRGMPLGLKEGEDGEAAARTSALH